MSIADLKAEQLLYSDVAIIDGVLTDEFNQFIDTLIREIEDLEARIIALEP